ncbi:hypothetical protein [Gymnodinialimonas ulvae]|uniref:hypothetical protein n=1 Tax=Gymnodinialimonas ulvae TaxID=3126504 RepID=UPI00309BE5E2
MNVSQFELIFKPQSPVPPADTVLQGYFLSISNLEDVALSFRLDLVTSSVPDPMRTLSGNTVVIVDVAGVNNDFSFELLGGPAASSFRLNRLITIPPQATAKVAILPDDPFPCPVGDGTADPADYEARGYVTLRLPALLNFDGGLLRFEPQIESEANVLLTPQNRATYFRDGETIESQTQAGLPLASGSALNQIPAEVGGFTIGDFTTRVDVAELPNEIDLDRAPELLAELMAVAAASDIDTRAFNAALKEVGIGMAIERRKVPATAPTPATRVPEEA